MMWRVAMAATAGLVYGTYADNMWLYGASGLTFMCLLTYMIVRGEVA